MFQNISIGSFQASWNYCFFFISFVLSWLTCGFNGSCDLKVPWEYYFYNKSGTRCFHMSRADLEEMPEDSSFPPVKVWNPLAVQEGFRGFQEPSGPEGSRHLLRQRVQGNLCGAQRVPWDLNTSHLCCTLFFNFSNSFFWEAGQWRMQFDQ